MNNLFYLVENEYNEKKSPEFFKNVEENLTFTKKIREADFILTIGGDGTLLDAIQSYKHLNIPFVGIHTGSVGYYMHNLLSPEDIL